jgi:hypothetical protein
MTREEKFKFFTQKYAGKANPLKAALLDVPEECGTFSKCLGIGITGFWEWHSEKNDIDVIVQLSKNNDKSFKVYWYCPQLHKGFTQAGVGRPMTIEACFAWLFRLLQDTIEERKKENRSWQVVNWGEYAWKDAATGLYIYIKLHDTLTGQPSLGKWNYAYAMLGKEENSYGYIDRNPMFNFSIHKDKQVDSDAFVKIAQESALKLVREYAAKIQEVFTLPI